jgi:Flp pilus assembly protein TadG
MLKKLFSRHHGRRGGAVLETALVLPILLMLTLTAGEYGYYFFLKHSLEGAAREGARAAIVPSTTTNTPVNQAVAGALHAAGLNKSATVMDSPTPYTISISPAVSSTSGTAIEVDVSGTWGTVGMNIISSTWLGGIGANKVVKGTAVMRKEG